MTVPTVGAEVISHVRQVCSLYKRVLRSLTAWAPQRDKFRYHAVLMRQRFEENRNIKDVNKAKALLADGEKELFKYDHPLPRKFHKSPGGTAFEREVHTPDWVLDYWHPLEKAQYPEYFARREVRKKQYIEMWEKQYGKPSADDASHH